MAYHFINIDQYRLLNMISYLERILFFNFRDLIRKTIFSHLFIKLMVINTSWFLMITQNVGYVGIGFFKKSRGYSAHFKKPKRIQSSIVINIAYERIMVQEYRHLALAIFLIIKKIYPLPISYR